MKIDPRDAILGLEPKPGHFPKMEAHVLGRFVGGHIDRWDWNRAAVRSLPEELAAAIYESMKNDGC